jgi:uncharacterized protein (DUF433 family)
MITRHSDLQRDGVSHVQGASPSKDAVSVIRRDPEIMSGTPVFAGTRVPIRNLIDYLKAGDNLDEFLDQFPSVSREQAIAALEDLAMATIGPLHADPPR